MENRICGGARNDSLQDKLDTIVLLRKIIGSKGRVGRKPYRTRKVAMEEEAGVIFYCSTSCTIFINVSGVPFSSGKCLAY